MKLQLIICCLYISYAHAAPAVVEIKSDPPSTLSSASVGTAKEVKDGLLVLQAKHGVEQEQDASSAMIKVPVDNANKLLYDLDATVNKLFDDQEPTIASAKAEKSEFEDVQAYSAANRELDFVPRQTDTAHGQKASVVNQLENLEKRLLNTISELQTRHRYFSSTMLRQMYNSVHRIRINISRIQTQFSSPHQSAQPSPSRPQSPGMMNNLQQRVSDIQKAVNDIINRVTSTFQGPSAPKPHQTKPVTQIN